MSLLREVFILYFAILSAFVYSRTLIVRTKHNQYLVSVKDNDNTNINKPALQAKDIKTSGDYIQQYTSGDDYIINEDEFKIEPGDYLDDLYYDDDWDGETEVVTESGGSSSEETSGRNSSEETETTPDESESGGSREESVTGINIEDTDDNEAQDLFFTDG